MITAAATIMVLVFASFVFAPQREVKLFGLSLGAAVVLDALVIRTMVVPAFTHLVGRANWWLPQRLERLLPRPTAEESAGA